MRGFIEYMKNEKRKAANTLIAYERDLTAFEKYLAGRGTDSLEKCTDNDAISYVLQLSNENKSKPTINRKVSALRMYYEYLIKHHRNTWAASCKQWLKGTNTANVEGELPELDPFQPKQLAAIAISRAKKSISCSINHQTKLVTITVKEQDPMVAALVAQATADELNRFTTDYYTDKVKQTYQLLQTHPLGQKLK